MVSSAKATVPGMPKSSGTDAVPPASVPAAPTAADLAQGPAQFPDGPNVAPSAHELEAARGEVLPLPSGHAEAAGPLPDSAGATPTPATGE
ncbi:MAG: hypothetical protein PHT57_15495 [Rhodoferax sp.]|nr:hypothetical protein [Rhodoferax sp.]